LPRFDDQKSHHSAKQRRASRSRKKLRLFVAAYPSPDVADAWLALVSDLGLPDHRLTPADQIHLTLQFIGDVDRRDLAATMESAERAAAACPAIELTPNRLLSLPEPNRHGRVDTRLVTIAAPAVSSLTTLHERLSQRLVRRPRRREKLLPHWTLLRFRSPIPGLLIDQPIDPQSLLIDRISLMQSQLRPSGAVHHELREFVLER